MIFAAPCLRWACSAWAPSASASAAAGFSVGTLTAAMALSESGRVAWPHQPGALSGHRRRRRHRHRRALRDVLSGLAVRGLLGRGLTEKAIGYSFVYHLEIALLFATWWRLVPWRASARPVANQPVSAWPKCPAN